MCDVYIDTLGELKKLYPTLDPCTGPSKTTEYGKNTYTLFHSTENTLTIGWRAWRIAQATIAVVLGVFPCCFIPFVISRYRDWIAECWNEGYTGVDKKISIYVLPIVLEEFNKKAEPETEKLNEEVLLTDLTKIEPNRQTSMENENTGSPVKSQKEEVLLTNLTKPEVSSQALSEIEYTDSPMKGQEEEAPLKDSTEIEPSKQGSAKGKRIGTPVKRLSVGSGYQQSRSSQRNIFNSNNTEMPTRPKTNNNQLPIVKSRETLFNQYKKLASNPPEGCTEEVKHKLEEILTDLYKRKNFNIKAVEEILELNLLESNALTELNDYSEAL